MLGTHIRNLGKPSNLDAWISDQFVGMGSAHFSWPYNRDIDPVIGRGITLGRPDMGGENEWSGGKRCLFEEGTSSSHIDGL